MIPSWIRRRIENAERLLADFAAQRRAYISCSWGKDSIVVLWIMRRLGLRLPVIWFDGGKFDEYPETAGFAARVVDSWDLDLHVARPDVPLLEQWRRCGPPDSRRTKEDRAYTREFVGALLRESRRLRCDGAVLGMRGDENPGQRGRLFRQRGPIYFVRQEQIWRCCPLWNWSTRDVWTVIDAEALPVHPVYTHTRFRRREDIRLGVMAETAFSRFGAIAEFRHYYPHLWNELCREFPAVAAME